MAIPSWGIPFRAICKSLQNQYNMGIQKDVSGRSSVPLCSEFLFHSPASSQAKDTLSGSSRRNCPSPARSHRLPSDSSCMFHILWDGIAPSSLWLVPVVCRDSQTASPMVYVGSVVGLLVFWWGGVSACSFCYLLKGNSLPYFRLIRWCTSLHARCLCTRTVGSAIWRDSAISVVVIS